MIGAIVMICVAIWIYQSGIKAQTTNVFMWVGICAAVFLASQLLLYNVNIYIADVFTGKDVTTEGYERDLTDVGDRKNQEGFQSTGGAVLSYFMELMPPLVGFLIVALVRVQFMLKEKISVATLFSGISEMFVGGFKGIVDTIKQGVKK